MTQASGTRGRPLRSVLQGVLRNWIVPLAATLAVFLPLRAAVADWYDVPTGSMKPTIIEGDRIFVSNLAFGLRIPLTRTWLARWDTPKRGDIVTLASPGDGTRLVKRVIGLPGDRIAMRDNRLLVNGRPLDYDILARDMLNVGVRDRETEVVTAEEHLPGHAHQVWFIPGTRTRSTFDEITVPDGHYFVMGDNRDQSLDSRFFGPVPLEHIYGRSSHVVMSLDRDHLLRPRFDRLLLGLI